MAMRVRLQTSPLGMCFRIAGLFLLGGAATLVVEHSDWLAGVRGAAAQVSAPIPAAHAAPTVPPTATPRPRAAPAAVTVQPRKGAVPPGWIDFFGIAIPPPGCNDKNPPPDCNVAH